MPFTAIFSQLFHRHCRHYATHEPGPTAAQRFAIPEPAARIYLRPLHVMPLLIVRFTQQRNRIEMMIIAPSPPLPDASHFPSRRHLSMPCRLYARRLERRDAAPAEVDCEMPLRAAPMAMLRLFARQPVICLPRCHDIAALRHRRRQRLPSRAMALPRSRQHAAFRAMMPPPRRHC